MAETGSSGLPPDIAAGIRTTAEDASRFEFGEAENTTFRELARAMSFVGMAFVAMAVFVGLGGIRSVLSREAAVGIAGLLQAAMFGIIGVWTRGGARAMKAIATTQGNDVAHLMFAIGQLKRIYVLQRTLMLVVLSLLALGIIAFGMASMLGAKA